MKIRSTDAVNALSELVDAGFTRDFRVRDGQLIEVGTGESVNPANLMVVAKLRFETEPDSGDASNIYVLDAGASVGKGLLVDALDLEGAGGPQDLVKILQAAKMVATHEGSESADQRYGVRKVRKAEFNADPERYVLRIDYPDFPECPFGQAFTMLGFDNAAQEYVWLVTSILRDDRLRRVPYQASQADT